MIYAFKSGFSFILNLKELKININSTSAAVYHFKKSISATCAIWIRFFQYSSLKGYVLLAPLKV